MITKYNANARTVLLNKSNGFLQQFPKATELDDDGTGAFCMFLFQLDRLHTVFFFFANLKQTADSNRYFL